VSLSPDGMRRSGVLIAAAVTLAVAGCADDPSPGATAARPSAPAAVATTTPTLPPATSPTTQPVASSPPPKATASRSAESPKVAISLAPLVKVGKPVDISDDVRITVGKVQDRKVAAEQPGEIAGPAAVVPVTVRNGSDKPFSLDGVVVTAFYNDDVPGIESTAGPSRPLAGSLAAGTSAKGIYVFTVPREYASTLRVEVSSDQSATIVQFAR
jgi:hypothetical protein